jgi:hypothetical protein
MAYLNANIPVEYAQIRREYLFDLKKHQGKGEKGQSFTDYLSQLLFNADLKLRTYLNVDLMSFSFGIVLVIILLLLLGTS